MDITSIFAFFDTTKPCPESILDCSKLREEYLREINSLTSNCKECERVSIRDKYIKIINK